MTTVIVQCPNLGITTRPTPKATLGLTTLRGKKVPYSHLANTFIMPAWLGGTAEISGISQWGRGDMKARYTRDRDDVLGGFTPVSKIITSPSASSLSLTVKESVGEAVYRWHKQMDLDVRLQSCGRVDDPTNWDMIKRLCGCIEEC